MFLLLYLLYNFDGKHRKGCKQYIGFNGATRNISCQEYCGKTYQEISRVLSNGKVFIKEESVKHFTEKGKYIILKISDMTYMVKARKGMDMIYSREDCNSVGFCGSGWQEGD
ncbi:MAG: hypothetical protein QW745_08935 [Thermoplasmata archaeon]